MTGPEWVALISALGVGALAREIITRVSPTKKEKQDYEAELRKSQIEEATKIREAAAVEAAALRREAFEEAQKVREEATSVRTEIRSDYNQLRAEANTLRADGLILRQESLKLRDRIDQLTERVRSLETEVHEANNKAMVLMAEVSETKLQNEQLKAELKQARGDSDAK
jgi:chromosome segregation ATPase